MRIRYAGASALVLGIVIFFGSPIAPYVRGIFASVFAPDATTVNAEYASLSQDALVARLADAESASALAKYQSVLYGLLADENAKLRKTLRANPTAQGILARALSRPPRTMYDTILVDQGSHSGIQKGGLAVFEGIALGTVVSLGPDTALVQLFSSSGSNQDVLVGTPLAIAVARGLGGGAFEASVPRGVSISIGDGVRMSGVEPLLLGVVVSVSSKPTDTTQTIRFRSPVSFSDIDFVEVISAPGRTP